MFYRLIFLSLHSLCRRRNEQMKRLVQEYLVCLPNVPEEMGTEHPFLCVSRLYGTLRSMGACCQRWGKLEEEEKAKAEIDLTEGRHVLTSSVEWWLSWFSLWIPVVLFLHQPWPWFWLELSSLFFLSLAKRRIKRLKETLKKLCTRDSYIYLHTHTYIWKPLRKSKCTISCSKLAIKFESDLGIKISITSAPQTRTGAVKKFTWPYELNEKIQ